MEGEDDQPLLAAFGNPLWDICIHLADDKVLSEFGLADDSSQEVTAAEYESLLKAVGSYPSQACPGGSALNSLRVFQWLHGRQNGTVFFGSVGKDETSKKLLEQVSRDGVDGRFKVQPSLTGSAICLIHGHLRTLVAHLGAANVYCKDDLTNEDKRVIERVKLVYIENFFFTHSQDVIWDVVKLCKTHGVGIVVNLSGAYLFTDHATVIEALVKCANIVIGNETEFMALSKLYECKNMELPVIAGIISKEGVQNPPCMQVGEGKSVSLENLRSLEKVVVVTRGPKPVLCAYQSELRLSMPILKPRNIKDTTGAGDAFVAGFLKGLVECLDIRDCIALGCYASTEIIQQVGCRPPHHNPMKVEDIKAMYSQEMKK
ncbi:adenosine kinase-like isoform X2 [Thrips palmi]|uniref:Adenosine kinase n=1 Tax=Thrips palmi TaxID=161013 RepID=A0A6P8YGR1_THRPL|nr:adenosine kinase-like isoform X2 [Thrips palmi]